MASENIETSTNKRVFIRLPKKYLPSLSRIYELDHGLIITELNPNVSEKYLATYFTEWGCVTMCKIKNSSSSTKSRLAYVRFLSEVEADCADLAGPHYLGGLECKVRQVVSPRVEGESEKEGMPVMTKSNSRRPMGLGYILEDPQWLDDDEEDEEQKNQF